MDNITIPPSYNYIGAFLTFRCNYRCSYCINNFAHGQIRTSEASGREWVEGLNRIVSRDDLPVSLQGGEPSLHKDFIYIINNIRPELKLDILTNLQFDVKDFVRQVDSRRIKRDSPYASMRVSFHPEVMDLGELTKKVLFMQDHGFHIGIWGVLHPKHRTSVLDAQEKCRKVGIDFRTKEFLGYHDGQLYGEYKYTDACLLQGRSKVLCKGTELLIAPDLNVYRCHGDLYASRASVGNLLDNGFNIQSDYLPCDNYGFCNPCDVKVKTNRFQVFGHTSVDIKPIS